MGGEETESLTKYSNFSYLYNYINLYTYHKQEPIINTFHILKEIEKKMLYR